MKKIISKISKHIPITVIFVIAVSLRVINLGYSDYQGDEIKAFFRPDQGESSADFLLNQRKGPGQFAVTYLISKIDPDYSNEFLFRIPFALAGTFSVIVFYKLLKELFDNKIAFYASFFFATNGFFVALSRIVQYQSFVIFFMLLALYYYLLSINREKCKKKGLFLGSLFWCFSILFHYDGLFIAPFVAYFIIVWFKDNVKQFSLKDEYFKYIFLILIISAAVLSFFYVPFIYNLSKSTVQYWSGRISGDVSSKISSSRYLFTVYQPIYVVHFYTLLFLIGFGYVSLGLAGLFESRVKIISKITKLFPSFKYGKSKVFSVLVWLLLPLIFLEVIVYIPGTHIYTYLLPMTIFIAMGIVFAEEYIKRFRKYFIPEVISSVFILLLFSFIYMQSYAVFVENSQEYPWESEKFLIWTFPKPTPIYHLSMFGFPYYRNWEGISETILSSDNNGYYSTNERKSIARFFVPFNKSTDNAGHYIQIINPQSFTNEIQQEKAKYWAERYPPIFTFSRSDKDLVRVYYMEQGTLEEIVEKGY